MNEETLVNKLNTIKEEKLSIENSSKVKMNSLEFLFQTNKAIFELFKRLQSKN